MIGSPWNPFFDQVIPGTGTRYDGRRTDASDPNQTGGFDAIRLPQHIQLQPRPFDDPIVLTRKYKHIGPSQSIIGEVVTYGILYNTALARSIRETGFCWWWRPQVPFLGRYPRVYYESDTLADFDDYVFTSDLSRDTTQGFRWRLGAGFDHRHAPQNPEAPVLKPQDWSNVWSLWLSDDIPVADGGNPEEITGIPTTFEQGDLGETYPLWVATGYHNESTVDGSRLISGIDLNRRSQLVNLTTSLTKSYTTIAPWYREG